MYTDKMMRAVLKYMSEQENASERRYDFDDDLTELAEKIKSDKESVRACVRRLEEYEYVEWILNSAGKPIRFILDHKGLQWREYRRKEIQDYIADKWIDGLAMLVSLVALYVSLFCKN